MVKITYAKTTSDDGAIRDYYNVRGSITSFYKNNMFVWNICDREPLAHLLDRINIIKWYKNNGNKHFDI